MINATLLQYLFIRLMHPSNLIQAVKGGYRDAGLRGTMTKVVMLIDAMLRRPEADWLVWMDDDSWVNPSE